MDREDPRRSVEAPVRRAMVALVVRGVALVGAVLLLALLPTVPAFGWLRSVAVWAVPAVLFGYAVLVVVERRVRGRPEESLRATAWFRAREVDDADAMLALLIAGWVPVALLVGLVLLAWPGLNDHDAATRGIWGAIGVPTLAAAWLIAANTWLEATRDELARALADADRRFRSYWANLGR